VGCEHRLVCRFSDAGSDEPCARSVGRRLKSAKARNRGKWGHRPVPLALWERDGTASNSRARAMLASLIQINDEHHRLCSLLGHYVRGPAVDRDMREAR
jgi:hypothetical protein